MLATTIDELRSIALDAGDASGYFPALYARVTDRIRAAATDGRFEDPRRMEDFAAPSPGGTCGPGPVRPMCQVAGGRRSTWPATTV